MEDELLEKYNKSRKSFKVDEIDFYLNDLNKKLFNNFIETINKAKESVKQEYDYVRVTFPNYEVEGRGEDYTIFNTLTLLFFKYETLEEFENRING